MLPGETVEREASSSAHEAPTPPPHVLLRAESLSKGYPRATTGAFGARIFARFGGITDAADEDDDELEDDELDPEVQAAGWVVRDIDVQLCEGSSTGIVGPPSSGKSTLVELLAGMTPPTSGKIVTAGRPVPVLDSLPKLMQDSTAWRNVVLLARVLGLSRRWAHQRLEPIFEFAGLTGSEGRLRTGMAISEVQRLAVATMLHVDGVVYLVDSSLGGRDHAFRERCLALLAEKQAAGAAVVHTSRELEGVQRLCEDVLWLERGSVIARGRPEEVAETIRHRRAARRSAGEGLRPTREAEQLLGFLRVAIGDVHAHDALHAATDAARAAGEERVGWTELAVAAGYDISDAQRIVDRLARRVDKDVAIVPGYDAHAAILGASLSVEDVDEASTLRVAVEVAIPGIELGCAVVLVDEEGRRLRLDQPEAFEAKRTGLYEVELVLPPDAFREGGYRGTVMVGIAAAGARSLLFRRDLLAFTAGASSEDIAGEPRLDTIEAYDPADDDVEFEHLSNLEWRVRLPGE